MQTVKRSWLLLLNWGLAALSGTCILAYMAFATFNIPDTSVAHWGITPFILAICAGHLIYAVVIYPWFSKRNLWLATIIEMAIYAMFFAAIIETSGRDNLIIRGGYVFFMFIVAMSGAFPPIGGIVITWALYVLVLLGSIPSTTQEIITTGIINIFVTIAGIAGWFFFRRYYLSHGKDNSSGLSQLLQQEKFKSDTILESITDGVMVVSIGNTVQVLNKSAATLVGWEKKEALNLDYHSLIIPAETPSPGEAAQETAIDICMKTKKATQLSTLIETKDKRRIYVDIVASPVLQTSKQANGDLVHTMVGVIAVLRDIDAQKRQEQQRSDFISTASHEMRTPVAAIEGYLALALNDKVSTVDSKTRSFLEKAHASTQHLGKLFQDLLTSAKAEDGRLVSHPVVVELGEYLEQLSDSLRFSAEKKGLLVDYILGAGQQGDSVTTGKIVKPLYYVHIDPDRMREVITNLFDNAVKYTPSGKISIGLTGNAEVVQLFVRDTGPGVPATDLPHLFQKFYRVDNSSTRTVGGTGLGLFICRKIVELYSGRIWAESEVGKGSTFYINLPRLSSAKAAQLQQAEAAVLASTSPLDRR